MFLGFYIHPRKGQEMESSQIVKKKVRLKPIPPDVSALTLINGFRIEARREGWTHDEIDSVLKHALQGDMDHLVAVIQLHCHDTG